MAQKTVALDVFKQYNFVNILEFYCLQLQYSELLIASVLQNFLTCGFFLYSDIN